MAELPAHLPTENRMKWVKLTAAAWFSGVAGATIAVFATFDAWAIYFFAAWSLAGLMPMLVVLLAMLWAEAIDAFRPDLTDPNPTKAQPRASEDTDGRSTP